VIKGILTVAKTPFALAVSYLHLHPVSVRCGLCNRQSEPGAFYVWRRCPEKAVINARQRFLENAATGIDHLYLEGVIRPPAVDVYFAPSGGVPDRVIDQIGKHELDLG